MTFEIDANGILHASAEDKSNALNMKKIQIVNEYRLTAQDIEQIVIDAERCKEEDEQISNSHEDKCKLLNYSFAMHRYMNDNTFKARLIDDEKELILNTLEKVNAGIKSLQDAAESINNNQHKELENVFNPIAERLNSTRQSNESIIEIVSSTMEPLGSA